LRDRVEQTLGDLGLRSCKLLVAASGGLDSTVLAHALAQVRRRFDLKLALGHVNHGLRGAESDADEVAVARLAERLGVDFACERVDPASERAGHPSRSRPTLQEAARTLRHAALRRLALRTGAQRIATGHHADDQAETVLMRLLRGCGPDALGGIAETSQDGVIVRPLLGIPRHEIHEYAMRHQLEWREDPSNQDPRYTRSRVRQQLLPGLAADFNPQLSRAICDLAEAQRRETEWVQALVQDEASRRFERGPESLGIRTQGFDQLPEALARHLVKQALIEAGAGRDLSRAHLIRALTFLREGRVGTEIQLPGGVRLAKETADRFRLSYAGAYPGAS
jgi:tRNA(Ile)-lysidine synthase